MPKSTVLLGVLLVVLGVVTWAISESRSPTALIPAAIGIVFVGLGVGAMFAGEARKHVMHAAAALALLLGFASLFRGLGAYLSATQTVGEDVKMLAIVSQILTGLLLLGFVVLCVMSFVRARRERLEGRGFEVVDNA